MKPIQFYILLVLGAACLILTILGMFLGKSDQHLQVELQSQQEEINRGTASQQMFQQLVRDIASGAVADSKLKDILTHAGFTIQQAPGTSGTNAAPPSASMP